MWSALLLGWVIGIALMGQCTWISGSIFYPLVVLISFWVLFIQLFAVHSERSLMRVCIGSLTLLLATLLGMSYAERTLTERLKHKVFSKQNVQVVVYVPRINQLTEHSVQQRLKVLNFASETQIWLSRQSLVAKQAPFEFSLGQYYQLQGELRPIQSYANLGGFDVEQWALQQNISAQIKIEQIELLAPEQLYALGLGHHLRQQQGFVQRCLLQVEQARLALRLFIQQQPIRHKGLMLALLSGDESFLNSSTEQLFQRFGLSHLLAISGPHVLILAFLCCALINLIIQRFIPSLYLRWPRHYFLLIPFNSCVLLYCAFVGFEIPALRTLLLSLSFSLAVIFKLRFSAFKMLLMSASLLLWLDPFSVLSAAFWLSYGACFILLRIYESMQHGMHQPAQPWKQKYLHALTLLMQSQWKIFLALMPLMLIFFQQVAWVAPFANMIAIPWIGLLIVPLDIVAALSFFVFPNLASLFFQVNDFFITALLAVLNFFDQLLQPQLQRVAFERIEILCLILALLILFLPRGMLPKFWAALCCVPLLWPNPNRYDFELNIIDVGQGQALFMRQAEHNMLLDVGGSYDERQFSVGERIILPYLSRKGVSKINELWLTHLDLDHSGTLPSILKNIAIQKIIANEKPESPANIAFEYCQQGLERQWSTAVKLQVLWPKAQHLPAVAFDRNEYSCVLLFEIKTAQKTWNILLMGDAGWATEYQLLQDYPDLKVDVLLLGHHGSRHSSAYDFLQQLAPKIAIVSAGLDNRYGHPSPQLLARLKALNIQVYQTSQSGTLQLSFNDQQQLQLQAYRHSKPWLRRN